MREGESKILRPLGVGLASVGLHFRIFEETGSRRPYQCLGEGRCVTCLGGRRAAPTYLAPMLHVSTKTPCVLNIGDAKGPDALRPQIARLLRHPEFGNLLIEVSLKGRKYTTKILRVLTEADDGENFGLDVIREILLRGDLTTEALAATVERLSNAEMLEEAPSLRREIELRHPGLDIGAL